MNELLHYINAKYPDKFDDITVEKIEFDSTTASCNIKFLYPNTFNLSNEDKQLLIKLCNDFLGNKIKANVKFKRIYFDFDIIIKDLVGHLKNGHPLIFSNLTPLNISISENDEGYMFVLTLSNNVGIGNLSEQFISEATKDLSKKYDEFFQYKIIQQDNIDDYSEIEHRKQIFDSIEVKSNPKLDVKLGEVVVGNLQTDHFMLFEEIVGEMKDCATAGTINYFTKKTYTKNEVEKEFYSIDIIQNSKSFSCAYFPKATDKDKELKLVAGEQIAVYGEIKMFKNQPSMTIKHISRCEFSINLPQIKKQPVPPQYRTVLPKQYEVSTQLDLFSSNNNVCDYLKNNNFVVFDVETTGLSPDFSDITEIGAIKLINGEFVEEFTTLVNPKTIITQEITDITGITNDMVKNAPVIEDVIPDFYKFCEGCVLVAYNIPFDISFINKNSKETGYIFDHQQNDALILARKYIKGLKNYNLKSVSKHLNVSLNNAHRALNDTIATAKVFMILAENIQ